ncbi:MAG: hypothetical protein FJ387_12890 [Verrucomicrobia bacterium]|nr:hypothetical protein [Verrucomicrobiota bacterium]
MNPAPSTPHPHPTPADWASFLYDELAPDRQAELGEHLAGCTACQAHLERWRLTQRALDTYRLTTRPGRSDRGLPALKWAVAAAWLLGLGLIAGRLTAPQPDLAQVRLALEPALRTQWQRDFQTELASAIRSVQAQTESQAADLAAAWAKARQADQEATLVLYQRWERQRMADLAWLRRDLETVAVNADAQFDTTQRALGQLVAFSQPGAYSPTGGAMP